MWGALEAGRPMPFVLEFTQSALDDLAHFRKYEQTLIVDQIEIQLSYEPAVQTRNRKPLEESELAEWELRIGDYRVFYDVNRAGASVKVKAIGYKEHGTFYLRGKEYDL
ncbi:MAG TPA: type II toxin-antitoxin system RelE/ParE family toxin [Pirellulales bacterium]|nr:type II toxin-antitoxin system RelE/ParE family toxin [Pirellulales bacterium]